MVSSISYCLQFLFVSFVVILFDFCHQRVSFALLHIFYICLKVNTHTINLPFCLSFSKLYSCMTFIFFINKLEIILKVFSSSFFLNSLYWRAFCSLRWGYLVDNWQWINQVIIKGNSSIACRIHLSEFNGHFTLDVLDIGLWLVLNVNLLKSIYWYVDIVYRLLFDVHGARDIYQFISFTF